MDFDSVIKKIKTRGYCKVELYPNHTRDIIDSSANCRELVKNASVGLRGWNCPHIPSHEDEKQSIYTLSDRAEAYIDWDMHKEVWRYYKNGHFVFVFGQYLDWTDEYSNIFGGDNPFEGMKPFEKLGVIETVYKLTEIFLFLSDLVENAGYKTKVNIAISYSGMKGRKLFVDETRRAPLFSEYKCYSDKIELQPIQISPSELKEAKLQLAIESTKKIFELFQWENPPISSFEQDQKKLIERRF